MVEEEEEEEESAVSVFICPFRSLNRQRDVWGI